MAKYPKKALTIYLAALVFMRIVPAMATEWAVDQTETGFIARGAGESLRVEVYSDDIVRVRRAPDGAPAERRSLVVTADRDPAATWNLTMETAASLLKTKRVTVRVSRADGSLTFLDEVGNVVLREKPGGSSFEPVFFDGQPFYSVKQAFSLAPEEGLYGLGQYQGGVMNWRGERLTMGQENTEAVTPFLLSANGYGILWDNPSVTKFRDGAEGMSLWSEAAEAIDYYFVFGPEPDAVVAGYRRLTGAAPMFPKWAYGYFQSRERYVNREVLTGVVREYRERGLPLDVIVLDWRWWGDDLHWSGMEWDEEDWPDPAGMMRELHDKYNAKLMISVWPKFGPQTKIYETLKSKGLLYVSSTGAVSPVHDAFSAEARDIVWDYARRGVFDTGVDAWWMDGTEPEIGGAGPAMTDNIKAAGPTALGPMARYVNAYSLTTTEGYYKGQRAATEDKRVFILTRSGFTGQQRNAAATWSGDIRATWNVFKKQIPAGLNFGMAGLPYWTTDIGAFFVDYGHGSANELYRELYVRWFQFGAFCPIFRSHGTSTPREIWRFGEPGDWAYDALAKFDRLRYRLMPYIYSIAWKVTDEGYTLMRGLPMDFREDLRTYKIDDQYMFGPAFLVNPVTEEMYNREKLSKSQKALRDERMQVQGTYYKVDKIQGRKVYLPAGSGWIDFWTGERMEGGQTIQAPAPIDIMPLFVRAGSIVPMGPDLQYATEKPADPIELRVYPGADGKFTLYEDENDNYNYEKGVRAVIPIAWDDASKTLLIGDRKGEFPGMLKERTFNVVLVKENRGVGGEPEPVPDKSVRYEGKAVAAVLE